ncbi:MAG TPA: flagellar motor protein MotB [Rhizomicrobium sp.]|nr:flagellar motor protein MotB [Rhizomicrobium sp.]
MASEGAVVIKKIKKGGHGGHHGGAWKVAYADFVTAMMAFFLLMWLINTTTPEQKRGIADYFSAQSISQTTSGAGGVLGGTDLGKAGAQAGGSIAINPKNSPPSKSQGAQAKAVDQKQGGSTEAQGTSPSSQVQSDQHLAEALPSAKDEQFATAAEAIHQAMQDMPDIAALSRQVITEVTPEGLRIQLVDQDQRPMFQPGSAEPMPYTRKMLTAVAKIIDRLPNRISISGHTDGEAFKGPDGTTNWELSAARANAARAILTASGVNSDRIYEVAGKAGSEPLLPEDPNASANRRISILLMKEAPPVPADVKP